MKLSYWLLLSILLALPVAAEPTSAQRNEARSGNGEEFFKLCLEAGSSRLVCACEFGAFREYADPWKLDMFARYTRVLILQDEGASESEINAARADVDRLYYEGEAEEVFGELMALDSPAISCDNADSFE